MNMENLANMSSRSESSSSHAHGVDVEDESIGVERKILTPSSRVKTSESPRSVYSPSSNVATWIANSPRNYSSAPSSAPGIENITMSWGVALKRNHIERKVDECPDLEAYASSPLWDRGRQVQAHLQGQGELLGDRPSPLRLSPVFGVPHQPRNVKADVYGHKKVGHSTMPSYRLRHPAYPKGTEKQGMDPPAQLSHPAYPWERAQIPQTHEVGGPQSGLSPVLNHPLQVELEHDQRAHTQDDLRYPRLESYGLQHPPYIFQLPELQSEQSQQTQSPPSLTELKTISSLPRSPSLTRNRSFQQISPHLQSQRPSMLSNGTTVADPLGLIIGARILDMPCVGKPSYPPAVDNNINDTPPFSLHVSEPSQRMRIEKVIEITPEVPEMPREVAEGLGQTNAGGGSVIGENQGGSTTVMENLLMPVNAPGGDGIIGLGLYDIEESVGGVVGWHVIPSAGEPHGQLVSSVVETLTTASPYKEIKPENSSPGEDDSDGALSISIPSLTSNDESLLARSSSLELATLSSASSPPNLKRKVDISFDGPEYQYWAPSPSLSSCLSRDPKRSRFDNESAPNDGMEAADSHYKAPTMTPLTTVMDDASGSHLLRSMPSQKVNGVEKDFLVPLHSRKLSNMEPPVIMSIWNSKSLRATFFS